MSVRTLALATCLVTLASPLTAQREADQANLVFTIAGAVSGGSDIWTVPKQPVFFDVVADTFALTRRRESGLGLLLAGMYFPGKNVGIAGEAFFVGGGQGDACTLGFQVQGSEGAAVCNVIDGGSRSSTAVVLAAGPVFRVNARKTITPYVRLSAGLQIGGRSTIDMSAQSGSEFVVIYDDADSRNFSGAFAAAAGFTASLGKGYQLRWEVRDNYLGFDEITEAAARDGQSPTRTLTYRHVWSFVLGFDIVLERRRGRRY